MNAPQGFWRGPFSQWSPTIRINVGFAIAILALLGAGGGSVLSIQARRAQTGWVGHTRDVIEQVDALVRVAERTWDAALLHAADPNPTIATQADSLASATLDILDTLKTLTTDNPAQLARVDSLQPSVAEHMAFIRAALKATRGRDADSVRAVLIKRGGTVLTARDRNIIDELRSAELTLLRLRTDRESAATARSMLSVGAGTLLAIFIVLGFALLLHRDLNKQRDVQRAIRESERSMKDFFDNASDMIHGTAPDGQIVYTNKSWRDTLGYTEEDLKKLKLIDVVAPGSRAMVLAGLPRVLAGEGLSGIEADWISKDGEIISVVGSVRARVVDGRVVEARAIFRDVTLKKEEEALARMALEALQAATRAKSEFLANMSHEIRTPMNAVIGLTGLLLDTPLESEQLEFVMTIRNSGDALLTIINDILDFSKIESGNLTLEEHPFDVRDCVESALDLVAGRAAQQDDNLAYLVADSVPQTLVGDVTRVRQVLVNLLSNAVKFTREGEVFAQVTSRETGDGKYKVEFTIRDTGIGIPADRIGRLFASFSQVDASTTRNYGGTGLGLAISKRLVELMGGSVGVESEVGKGSTFRFSIVVPAGQSARRSFLGGVTPVLLDRRVLVVDDNATNRKIVEQLARGWGMHPVSVESAKDALAAVARDAPYDLAILDMQMPEMDGETLAAEWRKSVGDATPPLILLSSVGRRATSSDKGFAAILTKPIKPSALFDALVSAITGVPHRRAGRSTAMPIDRTFGDRHPLRILLAEDNPVNQMVATRMCDRLGYRVDVVANGSEALDAALRIPYDLILMDVQMPEMDGLESTRRIHVELPSSRWPRITAMTASALESDRQDCADAGMNDYLAKPVTMDSLQSALLRAWEAKGSAV